MQQRSVQHFLPFLLLSPFCLGFDSPHAPPSAQILSFDSVCRYIWTISFVSPFKKQVSPHVFGSRLPPYDEIGLRMRVIKCCLDLKEVCLLDIVLVNSHLLRFTHLGSMLKSLLPVPITSTKHDVRFPIIWYNQDLHSWLLSFALKMLATW